MRHTLGQFEQMTAHGLRALISRCILGRGMVQSIVSLVLGTESSKIAAVILLASQNFSHNSSALPKDQDALRSSLQEESSSHTTALICVEACVASLILIGADKMPQGVKNEDYILNTIAAIKSHLLLNVLAVHSDRIGHMHRSSDGALLIVSPSTFLGIT